MHAAIFLFEKAKKSGSGYVCQQDFSCSLAEHLRSLTDMYKKQKRNQVILHYAGVYSFMYKPYMYKLICKSGCSLVKEMTLHLTNLHTLRRLKREIVIQLCCFYKLS